MMRPPKISVQTLTISAMLIALGVVLSVLIIPLSNITEITLTGLPIAVGGYLFGPWMGFIIGALIDVCGFLAVPRGPFFPGFTLSTALVGLIYGLFLYCGIWEKKSQRQSLLRDGNKGLALRVVLAHLVKTVSISFLLNCYLLSVFYGMNFKAVFLGSIPKEAITFPIDAFLIYSVIQVAKRIRPFNSDAHE